MLRSLAPRLVQQPCGPQWRQRVLARLLRVETRFASELCAVTKDKADDKVTEDKAAALVKGLDDNSADHLLQLWKTSRLSPFCKGSRVERFEPSEDVWPTAGFGRANIDGGLPDSEEIRSSEGRHRAYGVSEDDILASLDEDQRAAVIAPLDRPLYIQGAAGTGKTTVLQRRLLHLVIEKGVDPNSVLVVCFNTKGAEEFRAGVKKIAPQLLPTVSISTLQSLSYAILLRHYREAGYPMLPPFMTDKDQRDPFARSAWFFDNAKKASKYLATKFDQFELCMPEGYVSWEDPDIRQFWNTILTSKGYENPERQAIREEFFCNVRKFRSKFKKGGIAVLREHALFKSKGMYPDSPKLQRRQSRLWLKYHEMLRTNGVIDPDDMCMLAVQLLRENPKILARMRGRFSHLLIDNMEDIDWTQLKFCLAFKTPSITVAGDDNQSTREQRFAIPDVLALLKEKMEEIGFAQPTEERRPFAEPTEVDLRQNHRSPSPIAEVADVVFQPIQEFRLFAFAEGQTAVKLSKHDCANDEAQAIATKLLVLHSKKSWSNCAILLQSEFDDDENSNFEPIERALSKLRIPSVRWNDDKIVVNNAELHDYYEGFMDQKEFKDMLAFLKLSVNMNDDNAFRRALQRPSRPGLALHNPMGAILDELRQEHCKPMTLYEAAKKLIENPDRLGDRSVRGVQKLVEVIIPALQASSVVGVEKTLELACELLFYRDFRKLEVQAGQRRSVMIRGKRTKVKKRLKPITELPTLEILMDMANAFDRISANKFKYPVKQFLRRLSLYARTTMNLKGAVTIATISQTKGLQWDNVFVPNFNRFLFPDGVRRGQNPNISMQDRILYHIACSRARINLFMSANDL